MSLYVWLNSTIKVQRRASNPSRNTLNEPGYGTEANYPTVYSSVAARIDYVPEIVEWTETGERVNPSPSQTLMYVENTTILKPEDRITILTADDVNIVGRLYIVVNVYGEWDAMGNTHHYLAQLQVH